MKTARNRKQSDADNPLKQVCPGCNEPTHAGHCGDKLDKFVWLVIGPNVWGKGFSFDQAFAGAGKPKVYVVYVSSDPWVHVDDFGSIVYYPADPTSPFAHKPYHAVAFKQNKGIHVEFTLQSSGASWVGKGTGKHFTIDSRYNCHV